MGSTRFVPLAMAFLLLAGVAAPAEPQVVATMVADVGQGIPRSDGFPGDRPVTLPAVLDGWSYFYGNDGIHGLELWRSDGTPGGTHMVRDICPGRCSAASIFEQLAIARAGDRVFFAADDGVHGAELWVTDGSVSGTQLVADLRPGLRGSRPRSFQKVGNRLFFQAGPFSEPPALWVSDGTPLGTLEVKPAIGIGATAELGGKLVFGAEQPQDGLWISDGTPAGTIRVSSVQPWQNSWPEGAAFRVLGSLLVFQGRDTPGPSDPTLWVTDGTAEGTQELAPLSWPWGFQICGDWLYFTVWTTTSYELWRTQGTPATTLPIPMPGEARPVTTAGWKACAGDTLVFVAEDSASGWEPWSTDGTSAVPLGELRPGPDSSIELSAETNYQGSGPFFASLGDRVLLLANDGVHGLEPWVTDGTPGGTQLVLDSIPGPAGLVTAAFTRLLPKPRLGDSMPFQERAADGSLRLWKSDGSAAGTVVFSVLENQPSMFAVADGASIFTMPLLGCFAPIGGGLAFSADDGTSGRELWLTDGTEAGTTQVADLLTGPLGSYPGLCRPFGERLLFTHRPGADDSPDLSTLDPATSAIDLLATATGSATEVDSSTTADGDLLLALWELVRTNGTPSGTQSLGTFPTMPAAVASSGESVYVGSDHLGRYDPADGMISPLTGEGDPWRYPARLTPVAGDLLFFASDPATGQELWRSDGTPEGTELVVDLRPGSASAIEEDLFDWSRSSPPTTVSRERRSGAPTAPRRGPRKSRTFSPGPIPPRHAS